ncbi:hypothetical protein CEP52_001474 [Fusarium oligoseptatum]|uniref:DHHA2 domain-containing protein n=1 Tax=Fusarium oligoseptatum TaxID=2604345 RepID=A0A428UIV4_9HYPO|nr:hypothetical protein CEP52_001474 [Fusarium oligoseptatum]
MPILLQPSVVTMTSRLSLSAFLARARTALTAPAAQRKGPLTFVVGNESADLDSLCSAVVYAYIRSHTPPHTLHIPLSNLPRDDLALRTEMNAVLKHAGLNLTDLLTLSELPDLKPEETRWLLVDHNSLTGPLAKYSGQVFGCVDHHADEGTVPKDADPRVIEPCGSCMSLVVDESRKVWEELCRDVGEDEKARQDRSSSHPLRYRQPNLERKSQKTYFDEISAVKEDISHLSFRDIFRKDYKEWDGSGLKLGISCIVQNLDYLVDKAGDPKTLLDDFEAWAKERKLDVASIMTTSRPDGEFQRHLLVWGLTDGGRGAVERFVRDGERLKLETWKGGVLDDDETRFAWRQRELGASRKQVAPLLREALQKS